MKSKLSGLVAALTAALTPLTGCDASEPADEGERVRKAPEWTKDAVIYEVNVRQYTPEGTFSAFSDHLEELRDMGVTTLWFMPIHPISKTKRSGTLGSYYSVTDYREVNPEFGTAKDFAALVEKAHGMGFTVMLDWVANHTGWDCPWIKEHPDWYTQDEGGNIISPPKQNWPDVADLNYENADMRREMIGCMKYWVEKYDVDGFRCDYALGVPVDFWEDARAALDKVKPVYMLAEDGTSKELLNYAFDVNYNLSLYKAMITVGNDTKTANRLKLYIPDNYPEGSYTMNFLDNHDMNSYERTINGAFGDEKTPIFYSFIYSIPGVPMVYTGDEVGLDQMIKFMDRDPVKWETGRSYRGLLSRLAEIRSANPALYSGVYGGKIEYFDTGNNNALVFSREKDGNKVKCVFNLTKRETSADLSGFITGSETVLLHGQGADVLELAERPMNSGELTGGALLPWEFWILSAG